MSVTRLLGVLRARLTCWRMVRLGLLEPDGARYFLTAAGLGALGLLTLAAAVAGWLLRVRRDRASGGAA